MKILKYTAETKNEAMLKVKDELGSDALIISVKNIKPRGLYRLFRKPYVEVTAALEGNNEQKQNTDTLVMNETSKALGDENFLRILREFSKKTDVDLKKQVDINPKLETEKDEKEANKEKNNIPKSRNNNEESSDIINGESEEMYSTSPLVKIVYEQLLENEIDEKYINQLLTGITELASNEEMDINQVVSLVYKRIAKLIANFETIKLDTLGPKVVTFVGPTGVGKTTTIAKIASHFTLNQKKKVALITADTYRIAAVEQLRTYATILNIPIKVVYTPEELKDEVDALQDYDLILVDTAGRSPNHEGHHDELMLFLDQLEEKEIYLVLSMTTKYKDLLKITDLYGDAMDYRIIFTKLDETACYGNLLNIKMKTKANLSYITFGQNVPDDISEINVHEITKKILGGGE